MNRIIRFGTTFLAAAALLACQRTSGDGSGASQDTTKTATTDDQAGAAVSTSTPPATPPAPPAPQDVPAPPDVAAPPADAQKTASGLAYKHLQEGTGAQPNEWDEVKVHYTGWTTDGKMFDTSAKRGQPATFPLNRVIPGWTEGVQLLKQGGKARLWIPEELAYKGRPGAPQGMLVFDVELLEVIDRPEPPPAPADVAAPPKDAKKTEKGTFYKVLQPGTGKEHPTAESVVKVHYTGWTTDGKMFDSSVVRGEPISFPLTRVIPGWTDGLQTMVVGEKTRLWIPEELAYQGRPGAPQGMLVFDVELLGIEAAPAAPGGMPGNPHGAAPAGQPTDPKAADKKAADPKTEKKPADPKTADKKPADQPKQ
jgi:FKBP-type peptidyl-prolyl cis-trans isomerase